MARKAVTRLEKSSGSVKCRFKFAQIMIPMDEMGSQWGAKLLYLCNEMEFGIVIYKIKVTFISDKKIAFSPSFKIDTYFSAYSFIVIKALTDFFCKRKMHELN